MLKSCMFLKIALWIAGAILALFWLSIIYATRHNLDVNTALLSSSILLAGWIIAITIIHSSRSSHHYLHSQYLKFSTALGDQELNSKELGEKIGAVTATRRQEDGKFRNISILSDQQQHALETLIYERKICIRDQRYSLPKKG